MKWERGISWRKEKEYSKKDSRFVYKLVDAETRVIQGAISMSDAEGCVFIHLIESASHNRIAQRKYVNIAKLLIAFAGMRSFAIGGDGFVALLPKTRYREYYIKRYGAFPLTEGKLAIDGRITHHLISVYCK